jgi:release factor glutamine methyltransferase
MANAGVFDSFFRRADGRISGQEAGGFFQGAGLPQMTLAKNPLRTASILLVARHPEVYEPCDDSFALVDALLAEKANLLEQRPCLCVEVGCGSGYVITSLALILGDAVNAQFIATDISRTAAQVTRETLSAHGVQADVVVTDLVHGLEKRLAGSVDVLLFNPPYVPTPEHEVGAAGITATWAGGESGRVVIDRMLTIVDKLLSKKGWFYMITLTANNPSEICQIMKSKGFDSRIVIQRYTEEENLLVLKFWRETS